MPVLQTFAPAPLRSTVNALFLDFGVDYSFDNVEAVFAEADLVFVGVNNLNQAELREPIDGRIVLPGTVESGLTDWIQVVGRANEGVSLEALDRNGVAIDTVTSGGLANVTMTIDRTAAAAPDIGFVRLSANPPGSSFWVTAVQIESPVNIVRCDFDNNQACKLADLDGLYAVFYTPAPPTLPMFDLNEDDNVDGADLNQWLADAAARNGFEGSYLRGDTDLDRNIDVPDFSRLAAGYQPSGVQGFHSWLEETFDGDRNVDITDLFFLSENFAGPGYGARSIPEPLGLLLLLVGLVVLFAGCHAR